MGKLLIGEIMGPQGIPGEPGPQGERGEKGEPGDAPYISPDTGTWWVGDTDTGVQAQGEPGRDGTGGGVWGGITGDIEDQPDLMTLLEGKADKNLPWCAGYFQDTSLAVNVQKVYVPIVTNGDDSMIIGTRFTAPSDGIYTITANHGLAITTADIYLFINKNADLLNSSAKIAETFIINNTHPNTCSWTGKLIAGDFLSVSLVSPNHAVSSLNRDGVKGLFTFTRMR